MSRVTFDLATVMFLVWVVILFPTLGWLGDRHLARGKPLGSFSRRTFWAIVITLLVWILGWYSAETNEIPLAFQASIEDFIVGFFFAGMFLLAGWRGLQKAEPDRVQRLRLLYFAATTGEWLDSCLSGLTAGICEEIIYRGYCLHLLRESRQAP